ncbi:spore germination protein [Alicyclobacillus acidiphilus]|uniref:spore germination protein n=1 Tax=Alicyclobacillus acidiphilus TaxID=182455 RepID=UPI000834C092|nr:spore germination protein [Alicyclobacillus acidiphilus]
MRIRRSRPRIKLNSVKPILPEDPRTVAEQSTTTPPAKLFGHIEENLSYFRSVFHHASDVVFREFRIADGRSAAIIYVDVLSDTKLIDSDILSPLSEHEPSPHGPEHEGRLTLAQIQATFAHTSGAERVATLEDAVTAITTDMNILLIVDCEDEALALTAGGGVGRGVEEPNTEAVIRGPREGFNENLRTGIALIRRRIRSADFKVETMKVGRYTKTNVGICYIEGIVDNALVEEVRTRIERIDTDAIIDSGYIEENIEDSPYSPFPQIQNTERPDVVAASLLEGRIAILTDGSPFALIVPTVFWSALQASEDYYERYLIANAIRFLRYAFLLINLYLPSLYVAVTTFHQELLPEKALLSIAAAREVTPFPAVVEALIMEITFEALREAGVRLPKTVGSTISIVGALVIGQAAVQAGIVSAPMVIVVSITGIGSFVIPRYNFAITLRMLRFPMILLAASLGLFGIVAGTIAIILHLSALRSFGVPYLSPVAPFIRKGMQDTFIRVPHWRMSSRIFSKANPQRNTEATMPKNRTPAGKMQS